FRPHNCMASETMSLLTPISSSAMVSSTNTSPNQAETKEDNSTISPSDSSGTANDSGEANTPTIFVSKGDEHTSTQTTPLPLVNITTTTTPHHPMNTSQLHLIQSALESKLRKYMYRKKSMAYLLQFTQYLIQH